MNNTMRNSIILLNVIYTVPRLSVDMRGTCEVAPKNSLLKLQQKSH